MGKLKLPAVGNDCGNSRAAAVVGGDRLLLVARPFSCPRSREGAGLMSTTENAYLDAVKKFPRLTVAEERSLTDRIREGDAAARREMIERNLQLVVVVANDFRAYGVPFMDLIEEGNLGLMKAVKRYELGRGAKFSTYAVYWIKKAIRKAVCEQSRQVAIPAYAASQIAKLRKAHDVLANKFGREPNIAEMAEAAHMTVTRAERYLAMNQPPLYLDALHHSFEDESDYSNLGLLDPSVVDPADALDRKDNHAMLTELMGFLDKRSSQILTMRYGLDGDKPLTQEAIAHKLGITKQWVQELEAKALGYLRKWIEHRRAYGEGVATLLLAGRMSVVAGAAVPGQFRPMRRKPVHKLSAAAIGRIS